MKIKKIKMLLALVITMAVVFGFSVPSHATLFYRGTDTLGNKLIYDDDLNVTWYDYTNAVTTWQNQVNWASGLSVDFGGNTYDDWRLPTTVDGAYVSGTNGMTTAGYNITTSEMGHLFYTGLGNKGFYDTSGAAPQLGWGLSNTGDFDNLLASYYWSGTEYSADADYAWYFNFYSGHQDLTNKTTNLSALAVRPGDVSVVVTPEPSTYLLLGTGIAGLALWRRKRNSMRES